MINARMWLVVNPTVGIPLFLGAVAVGSFSVHVGIVTNTSWVGDFLSGRKLGSTDTAALPAPVEEASIEGARIVFEKSDSGETERAVVLLDDGRVGEVVFKAPVQTAALREAELKVGPRPAD
ncbi:MAG: light-harvesting protein [Pseudomonadota bacterium]